MTTGGDITAASGTGGGGWRLRMLGAFELQYDGRTVIEFTRRRQDVILAYLALRPTQDLARSTVAHLVWPDKSHRHALNRMTEVLTLLNKQLRDAAVPMVLIESGYQTFHLTRAVRTDVQEFEEAMSRALTETDPDRRFGLLGQAVALHGSGLLPALDDTWVVEERERLTAARDHAAQLLVGALAGTPVLAGQQRATGLQASDLARYVAVGRRLAPATPLPSRAATGELPAPGGSGRRGGGWDDPGLAERCLQIVETAEPHLSGPDRAGWLDRLDAERDGVYRVIDAAIENREAELVLRLIGALCPYWSARRRFDEGRLYLAQALMLVPRPEGRWYAKAAHGAGTLAMQQGDLDFARRRFDEALTIWRKLEDVEAIARVIDNLGIIAYKRGDRAAARACYAESAAILRQLDRPEILVKVLRNAALVEIADGELDAAGLLFRERVAIGRSLADRDIIAWGLVGLAGVVQPTDGWTATRPLIAEAETHFVALADFAGIATCLRFRGYDAQEFGAYDAAHAYYQSSLAICRALKDFGGVGESLRYLASVAELQGDAVQAHEYNRQALLLLESVADAEGAAKVRASMVEAQAEGVAAVASA
jgi:tetratricopeptide (TPR) repeat protein